jgi:ubiquinone/menaquinone biosynthesis C-methylase UbiE
LNPEEYGRMYEREDSYWYFQGRRAIISGLLRRNLPIKSRPLRVLDVGCGTGLMLEHLQGLGQRPVGLDKHELALSFCRKRGAKSLLRADVTRLPFRDDSFDVILALDLIEHVEDDRGLLDEFRRVTSRGGRAMITVPAHPFLWSEHDEALHHIRRYRRGPFLELLREAGFRPVRYTYAISLLFGPIVVFRQLQRLFKGRDRPKTDLIVLPRALNRLLIELLRLEGAFLRRANLPVGVSIFALVEPVK